MCITVRFMELWATLFARCVKGVFPFPHLVNGVVHDGMVSYAHFHDAVFMASLFILQKFDISYVFDFTSSIYDKKRRRKYHKEKRRKLL